MQVFYSDSFELPLPEDHRFPLRKYQLLRERLETGALRERLVFRVPDAASDDQLSLVHTREYLDQLTRGTLSRIEEKRIGFPWSLKMVERSRRSTGATIGAARAAANDGASVHLAGGTHHAFPDHGQGFCVFNDVAVAIRVLQADCLIQRAVVIDLDVHQGNGTASIFSDDFDVFTFSMHGESNFPFAKCNGDLDIALADGTNDDTYLSALTHALENSLPIADADMVFYLAGADPFEQDRYGKLKLSKSGLKRRDELVFESCKQHDCPIAVVMAGGYASNVEDIVAINTTTVECLLELMNESS